MARTSLTPTTVADCQTVTPVPRRDPAPPAADLGGTDVTEMGHSSAVPLYTSTQYSDLIAGIDGFEDQRGNCAAEKVSHQENPNIDPRGKPHYGYA